MRVINTDNKLFGCFITADGEYSAVLNRMWEASGTTGRDRNPKCPLWGKLSVYFCDQLPPQEGQPTRTMLFVFGREDDVKDITTLPVKVVGASRYLPMESILLDQGDLDSDMLKYMYVPTALSDAYPSADLFDESDYIDSNCIRYRAANLDAVSNDIHVYSRVKTESIREARSVGFRNIGQDIIDAPQHHRHTVELTFQLDSQRLFLAKSKHGYEIIFDADRKTFECIDSTDDCETGFLAITSDFNNVDIREALKFIINYLNVFPEDQVGLLSSSGRHIVDLRNTIFY